ncbi:winged helix-turn-helix transcriptional regulator [Viridibacillus arvi]|uniref:winged helix-turn-helix transcriptional regulator n=1 Tax=Viridibacillus arvi TaxID=263475 RepID=UPI0036CD0AE3
MFFDYYPKCSSRQINTASSWYLKRILAKQLKELEDDGLIQKEIFDELPIKVEYTLTALGEQLLPVITVMQDWGKKYIASQLK